MPIFIHVMPVVIHVMTSLKAYLTIKKIEDHFCS